MEITLFWNSIFVSALSLGFFLTFVLFRQYFKYKLKSQLFLGGFVFIFSTILLNNFAYWNQAMKEFPHFIYSTVSTRFLLVPLFYLYCKTFIQTTIAKKDYLHFLPFILLTVLFAPILTASGAEKLDLIQSFNEGNFPKWSYYTRHLKWLLTLQLISYPCYIYFKLSTFLNKTSINENKRQQIYWLYVFNSLVLLYGLLMFLYYVLVEWNIGGIQKDFYISLVMCIAVYGLTYLGMDKPDLLRGERFLQVFQHLKYSKTKLEETYLKKTIVRLEQLMHTEKIYLDADISLRSIAEKIDVPSHHISQALNQHLGKTFHDFINQYRIEYACQLLHNSSEHHNIKTVMYQSGFNNRASFNNNFKKFKGMTASQYLKENKV